MVSKMRTQRIADRIFEELSVLLLMEVSDPRLAAVSVTGVRVDRELAYASVYVSSLEGSEAADEIIQGLEHASGFLRRELAQRIQLRSFPRLRFFWDPNPERADHIEKLLASLPENDTEFSDESEGEKE